MANDSILHEIKTKYKNVNNVDLGDILDYFGNINPNKARNEWLLVRKEYLDDFPTIAKIRRFLSEKEPEQNDHVIELNNAAMKCRTCGMIYANKRERIAGVIHCPRCGDNFSDIISDIDDDYITFCQDNCFKCPLFENQGRGVYGPSCSGHGFFNSEIECNQCKCAGCCRAFSRKIEEPKRTEEEKKECEEKIDWQKKKKRNIEISKMAEDYAVQFMKNNSESNQPLEKLSNRV